MRAELNSYSTEGPGTVVPGPSYRLPYTRVVCRAAPSGIRKSDQLDFRQRPLTD